MAHISEADQQTALVGQLVRTEAGRQKLAVGLENAIRARIAKGTLTDQNLIYALARLKKFGYTMKWVRNA